MTKLNEMFPESESIFGIGNNHVFLDYLGNKAMHEWYVVPHYSFMGARLDHANWALCGDAAGFIDPILSQGVTLAVHYGYERGIEAANLIVDGVTNSTDGQVTETYYSEIALLNEVCELWYNKNLSSNYWKLKVQQVGNKFFNHFIEDPDTAFRLFTNLEHVRSDLSSFTESQMREMKKHLANESC